jgi:hypothetical protein
MNFLWNVLVMGSLYFMGRSHDEISSSLCATYISIVSFFSVLDSLECFLIYMCIDLITRLFTLSTDLLIHHILGSLITILGIYWIFNDDIGISQSICHKFITMEITTPILCLSKYFKRKSQCFYMTLCFSALLISWLFLRIFRPFQACFITFSYLQDFNYLYFAFLCGLFLLGLQCMWFLQLCVVGSNEIQKQFK